MASTSKSRWAAEDEESSEALALRKKEKEERKRLKEDKLRRQREAAEAAARARYQQEHGDEEGRPAKRRRTSDPESDASKSTVASAGAHTEGAHILSFPPSVFGSCRSVDLYEQLNNIEEGSYGFVSRARLKSSGEIVALKRLKVDHSASNREGFPVTGLREIQTLKACDDHPHIVHLREVVVGDIRNSQVGGGGGSNNDDLHVYLVLDFIEHDLKTLLSDNPEPFLLSESKTLLHQITGALSYLHSHYILHRDLKTSNLLLNNRGEIKLADFGMARYTRANPPPPSLTQLVVTLWYRAPELLLGAETYSFEIDIWSLGCVFAELMTSNPLFQGTNEVDQLSKIFGLLGPPTKDNWPSFQSLPNAKALHPLLHHQNSSSSSVAKNTVVAGVTSKKFPDLSPSGLDLLSSLLSMNPSRRPSAAEVLKHPYFREDPKPKPKEMFPTFPSRAGQEKRRKIVTPDAPGRGGKVRELKAEDFVGVL